jgi:biopolymer transport protein TolR
VVLGVDAHGALYLRGVPVAADSIEARLAAIYAFRAKDRILYLRADRRVRYGVLLRAMAAARDAGVRVVAAVAEPRPAPPEGARGGP